MRRVLITGARAPVALHLARLFADAGYEVVAADTLRAPLALPHDMWRGTTALPLPPRTRPALPQRLATLSRRSNRSRHPDVRRDLLSRLGVRDVWVFGGRPATRHA